MLVGTCNRGHYVGEMPCNTYKLSSQLVQRSSCPPDIAVSGLERGNHWGVYFVVRNEQSLGGILCGKWGAQDQVEESSCL